MVPDHADLLYSFWALSAQLRKPICGDENFMLNFNVPSSYAILKNCTNYAEENSHHVVLNKVALSHN